MMKLVVFETAILIFGCKKDAGKLIDSTEKTIESLSDTKDKDSLEDAELDQIKFKDYAERVPMIDLPFKFSCDSGLVWAEIDYDNNVIRKYQPKSAGILGKLFEDQKSVGIIYTFPADIVFPIIYVYDLNGEVMEKINLFELRDCLSDYAYNSRTRGLITEDLQLKAAIEVIECDDNEEHCDTTRTIVERVIY
jgi:hypothetical protein